MFSPQSLVEIVQVGEHFTFPEGSPAILGSEAPALTRTNGAYVSCGELVRIAFPKFATRASAAAHARAYGFRVELDAYERAITGIDQRACQKLCDGLRR